MSACVEHGDGVGVTEPGVGMVPSSLSIPRILASLDHHERAKVEVRLGRRLPDATDIVMRADVQAAGLREAAWGNTWSRSRPTRLTWTAPRRART